MPPTATLPAHAPRIFPQTAPGQMYMRLVTDEDQVILEHAASEDEAVGLADRDFAFTHLREHPTAVIYALVYNGDSGDCVSISILAASDVRAFDKAGMEPTE